MNDESPPDLPPLLGRGEVVPRRRWRWLLPLFLTVAAVSLVAVGALWITRDTDSASQRVMDRYLNLVEEGDSVQAYSLLCDRFRRDNPLPEYQSLLTLEKREAGGVTDHRIGAERRLVNGNRVVAYTVLRSDGQLILDALLVPERGQWRICAIDTRTRVATTTTADRSSEPARSQ